MKIAAAIVVAGLFYGAALFAAHRISILGMAVVVTLLAVLL